jgi:transposase
MVQLAWRFLMFQKHTGLAGHHLADHATDAWSGREAVCRLCRRHLPVFDAATGIERRAHTFVVVLGASNYAEARSTEGLAVGAHGKALALSIGGVPKAIVCNNLKARITAASRYESGINHIYQERAEHYDTAILPTRPRKPRDKAKVEVAVQIVQRFVLMLGFVPRESKVSIDSPNVWLSGG